MKCLDQIMKLSKGEVNLRHRAQNSLASKSRPWDAKASLSCGGRTSPRSFNTAGGNMSSTFTFLKTIQLSKAMFPIITFCWWFSRVIDFGFPEENDQVYWEPINFAEGFLKLHMIPGKIERKICLRVLQGGMAEM